MRKHLTTDRSGLRRVTVSVAVAIAAGYASLVIAGGIMNPLATKQPSGDLQIGWGRHPNASVVQYDVIQCPYAGTLTKCVPVAGVTNDPAFDEFNLTIAASEVLTHTNAVVKVAALDAAGTVIDRNTSNQFNEASPIPGDGTIPLDPGCQQNITTSQWPGEALKVIVDAGGVVQVNKAGGVYVTVARGYGLHEDDERLVGLTDFEKECIVILPAIVR